MANGRCIYGTEEILIFVQILTLKDFGFSLKKIQSILKETGRYKLCALKAQKTVLLKQQIRINKNLELIDFMIEQSKREKPMNTPDVKMPSHLEALKSKDDSAKHFDTSYVQEKMKAAFEKLRQETGEEYFESFMKKSSEMDIRDAQIYGGRMGQLFNQIQEAINQQRQIDSEEVQQLMAAQWEALKIIYPDTSSKRIYLAIRDQLCNNAITEGDQAVASLFHYVNQAMGAFAESHFSEN